MKVLVIGESCEDQFIYGETLRLAPEAPAPVFIPTRRTSNSGMAANVVANLKALGADVTFITNPNQIVKMRYVDDKTNYLLLRVDTGDKETKQMEKISADILKVYDAVVISDYCKGFVSEYDIFCICNLHDHVFVDTKKPVTRAFKLAKYIKINNHEYQASVGSIRDLPELESKMIVTLGKQGSRFNDKIYPVPDVEVKDVSGAGDSYLAGLVVEYMRSKDIEKAINFAGDCATNVVSRRGVAVVQL